MIVRCESHHATTTGRGDESPQLVETYDRIRVEFKYIAIGNILQ